MTSATDPSSVIPSSANPTSSRPIPTLDQLYEMTSIPDERVVIPNVDFAFYEQLVDSLPEGVHIHIDFDGKDLEIMSPGSFHEGLKTLMGRFVELTSEELEIPCAGYGSTTWKRPEIARGLEADECYYFSAEKLELTRKAGRRKSQRLAEFANPDLAIEVDISRSKIDREGIYAALRVPEVWQFDGERIVISKLGNGGAYQSVEQSAFLPVRAEEIGRWMLDEDSHDGSLWARRLRAGFEASWRRGWVGDPTPM